MSFQALQVKSHSGYSLQAVQTRGQPGVSPIAEVAAKL